MGCSSNSSFSMSSLGGLGGLSKASWDGISGAWDLGWWWKFLFLSSLSNRLGRKMQLHEARDSWCLTHVQLASRSISSAGKHLCSQWLMNSHGSISELSSCCMCCWLKVNFWKHMGCPEVLPAAVIGFSVSSRNLAPRVTDDETWWAAMNVLSAWSWAGSCSRAGFPGANPI